MPKNKGKGGKNRKRGTNKNEAVKRDLIKKEEGQTYGQVLKMLGNGRVECMCLDGMRRLGTIRGKMRKKIWVNHGDIILLGLRDYQDTKGDVIGKYQPDEVKKLIELHEMPESFGLFQTKGVSADADGGQSIIQFANSEESDSEEDDDPRRIRTVNADSDSDDDEEDDDEEDSDEEEGNPNQRRGGNPNQRRAADEDSDEEEEEEEEESEEEEVPVYTRDKPKVKDKRQLRQERKGQQQQKGGAPAKGKGGPPPKKGAPQAAQDSDDDLDIDAI